MQRIVTRLQSFNTRRKFCAAAVDSVWSSKVFLRTKKLKTLVGSHDLTQEELENLRIHFKKNFNYRIKNLDTKPKKR